MADTVPLYIRVQRESHAWLKSEAGRNGVTVAMLARLLLERETGNRVDVRQFVVSPGAFMEVSDED